MNDSAARVAGQASDPVDEAIEQAQIKTSFAANVFALETARDMDRSAFRLWA
jgi:flagellar basal body rod protein FlgC